jgi:hypothetical protein
MSEDELLRNVIATAGMFKWRVAHFRSVPVSRGDRIVWQTPVQADGVGFPDLVMVRGGRIVVAELKSHTGRLADEQRMWIGDFAATGAEAFVWRPSDWTDGTIEKVLR